MTDSLHLEVVSLGEEMVSQRKHMRELYSLVCKLRRLVEEQVSPLALDLAEELAKLEAEHRERKATESGLRQQLREQQEESLRLRSVLQAEEVEEADLHRRLQGVEAEVARVQHEALRHVGPTQTRGSLALSDEPAGPWQAQLLATSALVEPSALAIATHPVPSAAVARQAPWVISEPVTAPSVDHAPERTSAGTFASAATAQAQEPMSAPTQVSLTHRLKETSRVVLALTPPGHAASSPRPGERGVSGLQGPLALGAGVGLTGGAAPVRRLFSQQAVLSPRPGASAQTSARRRSAAAAPPASSASAAEVLAQLPLQKGSPTAASLRAPTLAGLRKVIAAPCSQGHGAGACWAPPVAERPVPPQQQHQSRQHGGPSISSRQASTGALGPPEPVAFPQQGQNSPNVSGSGTLSSVWHPVLASRRLQQ